jgi:MFS family permease
MDISMKATLGNEGKSVLADSSPGSPLPQAAVDAHDVYAKIKWRILPFLIVCYVVAFIDRTNIGIAKLGFTHDLSFDEGVYGFGAGIFYLGYILLEIPSNLYLSRLGIRKTLMRIMLLWGACCSALALMATASEYYLLRFLLGAAEAGLFPGILLYVTFWIPAARRARITALFMAAIPIAGILGGPLAGAIMHAFGRWHGIPGWRWLFLLEGLPAILLGIAAYFYLDDGPAQSRWLSAAEKSLVLADLRQEDAVKATADGVRTSFGEVLRDPRFYAIASLGLAIMVSTAGVFLWLPTIIQRTGVHDVVQIGLLSAIPFIAGFTAQFFVARASDRSLERRWHAAIPAILSAVGWASLPFAAGNPSLSLLLLTLATAGSLAAMGPYWTLPTVYLSGTSAAGGIALITTIAGFGNFISPILVGQLSRRTGSLAAGQIYFAVLLLLGAALFLIGGRAVPSKRAAADGSDAARPDASQSSVSQPRHI